MRFDLSTSIFNIILRYDVLKMIEYWPVAPKLTIEIYAWYLPLSLQDIYQIVIVDILRCCTKRNCLRNCCWRFQICWWWNRSKLRRWLFLVTDFKYRNVFCLCSHLFLLHVRKEWNDVGHALSDSCYFRMI